MEHRSKARLAKAFVAKKFALTGRAKRKGGFGMKGNIHRR
jgi:hypothetical protein